MPYLRSVALSVLLLLSCCCSRTNVSANSAASTEVTVGVTTSAYQPLSQDLTLSSELVPFQEIDVYAKEPGYVKQLLVDYGSHVHAGQLMAVLEIPELEATIAQRRAQIAAQNDEIQKAQDDIASAKAQNKVAHLQYNRMAGVAASQPGLLAQQEVDDAQGKDLAGQSQVQAAEGAYRAAVGQLGALKAQLAQAEALYSYARITAPFDGVITQRYANLGAMMQAGTSSTQATPLVKLSQENLFRLVIPVPESDVRYIHIGDPVEVRVPSLGRSFKGKVARYSVDVAGATRTMHTEVDVPNVDSRLVPGLYAEAVITLDRKTSALAVPLQAIDRAGGYTTVTVVDSDNRIQVRPVKLGIQTENAAEAVGGLQAGERVVLTERSGLKPGQIVKVQNVAPMAYDSGASSQE